MTCRASHGRLTYEYLRVTYYYFNYYFNYYFYYYFNLSTATPRNQRA